MKMTVIRNKTFYKHLAEEEKYKQWMDKVGELMLDETDGEISIEDLPDSDTRTMFDDDLSPAEALIEILEFVGFYE